MTCPASNLSTLREYLFGYPSQGPRFDSCPRLNHEQIPKNEITNNKKLKFAFDELDLQCIYYIKNFCHGLYKGGMKFNLKSVRFVVQISLYNFSVMKVKSLKDLLILLTLWIILNWKWFSSIYPIFATKIWLKLKP